MRQGWIRAQAALGLFLVLVPAAHVRAQNGAASPSLPDDRLGIRTAPLLLLSRPDVRTDLGLNEKQAVEAEKVIAGLYARARALKGKTGPQADAERKAVDEAQREWFISHLTEEQRTRLVQVDLQWEGPSALVSRPVVADHLGLSPEQRAALKQAVAKRDEARVRGTYTIADDRALARQALTILTNQQWERWRAMLGRRFAPQLASSKAEPAR